MNDPNRPVTGYPASAGVGALPPNPNGCGGPVPQTLSGAGYPYAVEPPSSAAYYHHNPYCQSNHYAAQQATCFRRVIGIAIGVMVFMGTFIFVLSLILHPKLPEFRIDSFSVSNLTLNNLLISANWDLCFTVRNPNKKMTLYYDEFAAAVFYESASLSDTTVPPFFRDKIVQTAKKASFYTSGAYVDNWVFDGMNKERSTKGAIGFNVKMMYSVRLKAGPWRARRRYVRVYCKDLSVGVGSNNSTGSLLGGSWQCRVRLLTVTFACCKLIKATSVIQEESAEEVPFAADALNVLVENKIESKQAGADGSSHSAELSKATSVSQEEAAEEAPSAADTLVQNSNDCKVDENEQIDMEVPIEEISGTEAAAEGVNNSVENKSVQQEATAIDQATSS